VSTHEKKEKRPARDIVIPLLIGMLGVVGVVVAAIFAGGFRFIDVVLLLVVVAFAALGYLQRILRGVMTFPFLYMATGVAATYYEAAAPYIGAPFGDFREVTPPPGIRAFSFMVLFLVIWIPLEAIARAFLKDTSLAKLRILDNFGGVLIYAVVGLVIIALIFNAIGYGQRWQGPLTKAKLRSLVRDIVGIIYTIQGFWFPPGDPQVYTAGLK
jgi:uncharacterized membrane protein required for colicin V production